MEVKQIASLVNSVTKEISGEIPVMEEGLGNIVDVGNEIIDSSYIDNYVRKLSNQIGKTIFSVRPYSGSVPSVMMDNWEYGSILQKIDCEIPDVTENDSWNLINGNDYSPNTFYKPAISSKFFNKRVTFEIPVSITERQIRESFLSGTQMNAFISMLMQTVENAMTINLDNLIMRTLNNMIGETFASEGMEVEELLPEPLLGSVSGVKCINLTTCGRVVFDTENKMPREWMIRNSDFIKDAVFEMMLYADRLSKVSTIFNIGGKQKFTPKEDLRIVMLSDFKSSMGVYLNSSLYHEEFTQLPKADIVPYWQGTGTSYDLQSLSSIHVKTSNGTTVNRKGIMAVMFDKLALGVTNLDSRVQTQFNAKGEFYNNFFKFDVGLFNDFNENFIVFFAGTLGND